MIINTFSFVKYYLKFLLYGNIHSSAVIYKQFYL